MRTRDDFEQAYGPQLWQDPGAVIRAQLQWHQGGQNGCLFGQLAARRATLSGPSGSDPGMEPASCAGASQTRTPPGWRLQVVTSDCDLSAILSQAIADPDCQLLSLLWPELTHPQDLVALVRRLARTPGLRLTRQEVVEARVAVSLRAPIGRVPIQAAGERPGSLPADGKGAGLADEGELVLAWIMGFGPFECMPATRRAPSTELVIRVKPKCPWLYPKHSQDRACAHVADVPLGLDEQGWDSLWEPTFAATRAVLGGPPDQFSAARTTFTLPVQEWLEGS